MAGIRITGGDACGRIINAPAGMLVRPTASKIRQAFFNIVFAKISDGTFLDLFAGSGLMGVEALSRGAKTVIFVEARKHLIDNIRANLKQLDYEFRAQLINKDVQLALPQLQPNSFDIIFVDPPYKSQLYLSTLNTISDLNLLKADGILAAEHAYDKNPPEILGKLAKIDCRKYGQTAISFFQKMGGT